MNDLTSGSHICASVLTTRRGFFAGGLALSGMLASGCKTRSHTETMPLRVAARPDVLEAGPLLHAAAALGSDRVIVSGGGVPNLIDGAVPDALDRFPGLTDAAGQSETQLLRLSVTNPELRIVMTVTEGLYRIVGRRSQRISRLADLKGKRIGTFVRTSAAFFVNRMLHSVGLEESDVQLIALRPGEMASALLDRRVDAIAIWEPESERAYAMIGEDAISFSDPGIYRELYNLNTTAQVLADPIRRAKLVAFARELIRSCRTSVERPEAVWPLVVRESGFDAGLVAASWPHHRFPASLPSDLLDVLVAQEAWIAAQEGRAPRNRATLDRLIDRTILAEATQG